MPRFSIIVPVYNTSKYLRKCLDSILSQSFNDYEVIIVNDGSTDESEKIIADYLNKYSNFKYFYKKNGGLSSARNYGVSKSNGEYILFLDSDDYYEQDLLNILNKNVYDCDIIRFGVQDIDDNNSVIKYNDFQFDKVSGIEAFSFLCKFHYVEIACAYCYKRDFWVMNDFKFLDDAFHEDFGLIPLVLIKSLSVKSIDYIGYNYFQRSNSISKCVQYDKVLKKANDFLKHFIFLKKESCKISGDLSIFNSYIANSVILKSTTLRGNDYRKYIMELRKNGAFDMLLHDSIGRKIKKFLIRFSPKIYYKLVRR
jgi:glycosyltransferase involved in cell wall biosynthesis